MTQVTPPAPAGLPGADERARVVAEILSADPPESDALIPYVEIYRLAGVSPPDEGARDDFVEWGLWDRAFRSRLKEHVSALSGRWLRTEPGEGFRLLASGEVAGYAELQFHRKAANELRRWSTVVGNVRADALTADERREHSDTMVRLGKSAQWLNAQRKAIERRALLGFGD